MSFILQLFHRPGIRTVQEAVEHIERDAPPTPDLEKRFGQFVAEITSVYPNPSDDDEGDSAWPEGLDADGHDSAVYTFMVNLDFLDQNLVAHLGRAAGQAGLTILDPQNGLLYPVNGRMVQMNGASAPLPDPRPVDPPPPRGLPPGFDDEGEVNTKLAKQLAAVLAPHGFACDSTRLVVRNLGRVKQGIDVGVMKGGREMTLYLRLTLFCPEVAALWPELLGEPVAAYLEFQRKNVTRYSYDVHLFASDLRRPPSEVSKPIGAYKFYEAHDWEEAHAWLRQVVRWLKEEGLADLDRMKDPAGLAHFVLNDTQLQRMSLRNDLLPHELFARMILMGAFDAGRREQWTEAFWNHFGRSSLRYEDSNPIKGFKGLAEKLFAWLETEEFARVAERLK